MKYLLIILLVSWGVKAGDLNTLNAKMALIEASKNLVTLTSAPGDNSDYNGNKFALFMLETTQNVIVAGLNNGYSCENIANIIKGQIDATKVENKQHKKVFDIYRSASVEYTYSLCNSLAG